MYLGAPGRRASVERVASFYGISLDHVAKVVSQLVRLGYVRSIRGLGGGIELGKPADQILLGDVIIAFEGNSHLLECLGRDGVCVIESFCKLKKALAKAEALQRDYLNGITLQDLLPSRNQIAV
jgi:Rrf2 family nitric oxide-sensitive transcriptional repressor